MVRTNQPAVETAINRDPTPELSPGEESAFFKTTLPPPYLPQLQDDVERFVTAQKEAGRRIAVVSSGGTTVPLENNTVRFIDNFSAGTRGAASAEYFLAQGYAVIFMHREFSLLPYSRHYSTQNLMDLLEVNESGAVTVREQFSASMRRDLETYKKMIAENMLLLVPFTTVTQYLYTLRMTGLVLQGYGSRAMFYLAAAVSDFFLPMSRTAEHKIQSQGAELKIHLDPVPKFLRALVQTWTPGAMIVSFKLETDENLLLKKCNQALGNYRHQLVIGNLLQTRKEEVYLVTQERAERVTLGPSDGEIESVFLPKVIKLHEEYINQSESSE